ncbi:MAG: glycosyltransferase family 39 protein [Chloroflexi bacterium]|nr:glycosyltransferase family 39 protein [Chloroflexota bacterium]
MRRIGASWGAAILLLAFGLRVYHLAFQASLSDDALGLVLARQNPLALFSITATEPFPPTFYVTLSLWTKLAGTSEFGGRFYSLIFSVLAAAVMYRGGRQWLGQRTGLIAAFLMAINPMDIFFAQEVRMYSMLTLFTVAGSWFGYRLVAAKKRDWGWYFGASALAVMTHAFALFVLFAHSLAALLVGPREGKWLRSWAACQLGVVVVFGVWVSLVARRLEAYTNALVSAPPLYEALWRGFTAYALGFTPAAGAAVILPGLLVGLVTLGVLWAGRRRTSGVFLVCWLLAPFLVVWAVSFVRPVFYERYLVICLPPALLLAAAGIRGLEANFRLTVRIVGPALASLAMLAVAVGSGSHLRSYYQTVVYATGDDMRQLAAYVSSVADPIVVTNVARGDPLYGYYLPRSVPISSTLDVQASQLGQLTSQHPVIWFLPFGQSDHQQQAFDWLQANTYPAGSRWFGNAQVLGFASPAPSSVSSASLAFDDGIQLESAAFTPRVQAGQPVDVTLRWTANAQPSKDYSVFVHLLDAGGMTAGQHDSWPAAGARPTSAWPPGETIEDRHGLLTTASFTPGAYQLEIGLYDAAGQRLPLTDGRTSAIVGSVLVG